MTLIVYRSSQLRVNFFIVLELETAEVGRERLTNEQVQGKGGLIFVERGHANLPASVPLEILTERKKV